MPAGKAEELKPSFLKGAADFFALPFLKLVKKANRFGGAGITPEAALYCWITYSCRVSFYKYSMDISRTGTVLLC